MNILEINAAIDQILVSRGMKPSTVSERLTIPKITYQEAEYFHGQIACANWIISWRAMPKSVSVPKSAPALTA